MENADLKRSSLKPKETAAPKSFLDSLRDTVRNKPVMALVLAIVIVAGCKGSCTFGKKGSEAFSCSCTGSESAKKKDPTYKELKNDTSNL